MTRAWDATTYDAAHSFVAALGAPLIDLLDPKPGERVLDVGCGTGTLTAQLAERGCTVVGVDASEEMLARARLEHPGLDVRLGDATDLGFDREFDAVFSNATLHWVRPPEAAVASMAASLKPGGRLVVEFGGHGNVAELYGALSDAIREIAGVNVRNDKFFPTIGEYAGLLEQGGFEVSSALLFDRPTPLPAGVQTWWRMFGVDMLSAVPEAARGEVLDRAEELARPVLHDDAGWFADYRRIRVAARLP